MYIVSVHGMAVLFSYKACFFRKNGFFKCLEVFNEAVMCVRHVSIKFRNVMYGWFLMCTIWAMAWSMDRRSHMGGVADGSPESYGQLGRWIAGAIWAA